MTARQNCRDTQPSPVNWIENRVAFVITQTELHEILLPLLSPGTIEKQLLTINGSLHSLLNELVYTLIDFPVILSTCNQR